MSKIEQLRELLEQYHHRKDAVRVTTEGLLKLRAELEYDTKALAETVTELQELGFDVATFEVEDVPINDLIDEEEVEASNIPPKPEGEGWKRNTGVKPFEDDTTAVEVVFPSGERDTCEAWQYAWELWSQASPDAATPNIIWYRKAPPETQAEPAPAPEGFIPWDGGPDPFREMSDADLLAVQKAWTEDETCGTWYGYCEANPRSLILADEAQWTHTCDDDLYHITALKLPSGYELVDAEGGKVVRKIDHAADPAPAPETDLTTWNEIPGVGYVAGCGVANLETPTDHFAEATAQIEAQAVGKSENPPVEYIKLAEELIKAERLRQETDEGYKAERDEGYTDGQLLKASKAYFIADSDPSAAAQLWPWRANTWKPKTQKENLIRSGALALAEIDRQKRAGAEDFDTVQALGRHLDAHQELAILLADEDQAESESTETDVSPICVNPDIQDHMVITGGVYAPVQSLEQKAESPSTEAMEAGAENSDTAEEVPENAEENAGAETVTEEPEASADEPKLVINDIENTVTRGGKATDDPFQAPHQAFNAET